MCKGLMKNVSIVLFSSRDIFADVRIADAVARECLDGEPTIVDACLR
jgi:hypothetical protein